MQLSSARKSAAQMLQKQVVKQLRELAMPDVRFQVAFDAEVAADGLQVGERRLRVFEDGVDKVEFLIAPNINQPLQPLRHIASGGELARVMLALKSCLSRRHDIPILIFDEIDVGIGGRTADAVAEKLKQLAQFAQVLCVTHLPQIASCADAHYAVEKRRVDGDVQIEVRRVTGEQQVEELARMLGADRSAETARRHAEALIGRSSDGGKRSGAHSGKQGQTNKNAARRSRSIGR